MTLSLKIKHTGPSYLAASVLRNGVEYLRLQPGAEGEITLWDTAPLSIVEVPAEPKKTDD